MEKDNGRRRLEKKGAASSFLEMERQKSKCHIKKALI